jgi:NAD(P)-dependent dehydrogenase (short-subunit alcohol dehydrogenase family)
MSAVFSGKTVLVTGGATGIGRATCVAFANAGAAVLIGDVDDRATETVAAITAAGGKAAYVKADVTSAAAMTALVEECVSRFGSMDFAFNNAGVLPPQRPLHEVTEAELDLAIDVDLKGVFFAMQAEIRHFLNVGGGAIVNTASVGGVIADPNMSAYVACKHAVVGLTKALALDHSHTGVRFNAICPGRVETPFVKARIAEAEQETEELKHYVATAG